MIGFELIFDGEECASRLYGEAELPERWLDSGIFGAGEFYVGRIMLGDISSAQNFFPKSGALFFFIDMQKSPYSAIIRYFDGELDAATDFNDGFSSVEDFQTEIGLKPHDMPEECYITMLREAGDEIYLLTIESPEGERLLPIDGTVSFAVKKSDLKRLNFSSARLVIQKNGETK